MKGLGTAFGICGVLLSVDNQVILAQRKAGNLHPGNMVSVPVGFIDPTDARDGIIDPFMTFERELKEEAGLTPNDLSEYYCAGLVRENYTGASALVVLAKSKLKAEEIIKGGVNEEVRLSALPNDPEKIAKFVAEYTLIDTILSIGALELALDEMDNRPSLVDWVQKRTERRNTFYEEKLTPEQRSELARRKRQRLTSKL
ncbi:MAG: NUDIX hydrolase [Candidatus Roizmanbacteria bacterium]|nr:MAG: NUDIX hydrolase [Candidatus Roizmanbacteria bacterium]